MSFPLGGGYCTTEVHVLSLSCSPPTGVEDILFYQAPVLLAYFLLMVWITPSRYLPIVSSAVGAFATFRMLPTVISSLVRPFGSRLR